MVIQARAPSSQTRPPQSPTRSWSPRPHTASSHPGARAPPSPPRGSASTLLPRPCPWCPPAVSVRVPRSRRGGLPSARRAPSRSSGLPAADPSLWLSPPPSPSPPRTLPPACNVASLPRQLLNSHRRPRAPRGARHPPRQGSSRPWCRSFLPQRLVLPPPGKAAVAADTRRWKKLEAGKVAARHHGGPLAP